MPLELHHTNDARADRVISGLHAYGSEIAALRTSQTLVREEITGLEEELRNLRGEVESLRDVVEHARHMVEVRISGFLTVDLHLCPCSRREQFTVRLFSPALLSGLGSMHFLSHSSVCHFL